ncbi:MAG: hypothetical protein ACR2RV_27755 [Verrucomicrobiales bacterium]
MRIRARRLSLVVAALLVTTLTPTLPVCAQSGRPKTVHDLILELGEKPREATQLRLKIEGKLVAKDLKGLPEEVKINLFYDEPTNRVRVVEESIYGSGAQKKITSLATKERALIWTERTPPAGEVAPPLEVQAIDAALALPNPWRLPVKLGYSGMFADALHGYEALGREYARSSRMNREPDERGLVWFDLRPSPGAGKAMRYEFNAGLELKAAFAADSGWLQVVEVHYAKSDAVMTLTVIDRVTELSAEELEGFEFPQRVLKAPRLPRGAKKPAEGLKEPQVGPRRDLELKKADPASAGGR